MQSNILLRNLIEGVNIVTRYIGTFNKVMEQNIATNDSHVKAYAGWVVLA